MGAQARGGRQPTHCAERVGSAKFPGFPFQVRKPGFHHRPSRREKPTLIDLGTDPAARSVSARIPTARPSSCSLRRTVAFISSPRPGCGALIVGERSHRLGHHGFPNGACRSHGRRQSVLLAVRGLFLDHLSGGSHGRQHAANCHHHRANSKSAAICSRQIGPGSNASIQSA